MDGDAVREVQSGLEWLVGGHPHKTDKSRVKATDLATMARVLHLDGATVEARVEHECRTAARRLIAASEDAHWTTNRDGESERDLALSLLDESVSVGDKDTNVRDFHNAAGDKKAWRKARNELVMKIANIIVDVHVTLQEPGPSEEERTKSRTPRFAGMALLAGVFAVLIFMLARWDGEALTVELLEENLECTGLAGLREVALVRGLEPFEPVRYVVDPEPTDELTATTADGRGIRSVNWWCGPADVGDAVVIEVTGIATNRSVDFRIDYVAPPAPGPLRFEPVPATCSIRSCNSLDNAVSASTSGFTPGGEVLVDIRTPSGQLANDLAGPYAHNRVLIAQPDGAVEWRYWWDPGMDEGDYVATVTDLASGRTVESTFVLVD